MGEFFRTLLSLGAKLHRAAQQVQHAPGQDNPQEGSHMSQHRRSSKVNSSDYPFLGAKLPLQITLSVSPEALYVYVCLYIRYER